MGWSILKITDGTLSIDLLSTKGGYLLDEWLPVIPIPKAGGIWNSSPLIDGRRLALRNYENAIEVFNLKASRASQDTLIRSLQDLLRLLDKAVNYWITDWQTCPVWIEAKASNETNTRYAIIMDYRLAGLNNPYAQPFFLCPSIEDELTLTIERDWWTEKAPGTTTAVQVSAQQAYNGVTLGRSATTLDEVFITNKHTQANITHVYRFDDDAGTYTQIFGAALPADIFPPDMDENDFLYIGCSTAIANSGPFSSAIFDISIAADTITGIEVEYYDSGTGWTVFTAANLTDGTDNFLSTGIKYINFIPNADWTPNAINGVTAYWIRISYTMSAKGVVPEQNNRNIYAAVVPYVLVDDLQVIGDVPALSRIKVINHYAYNNELGAAKDDREANYLIGIRSTSRGSNFTPYINLADEQNNVGITITPGVDVAIETDIGAPAGRSYSWTPTTDLEAVRLTVSFTNTLLQEYAGKYHVYLRLRCDDVGDNHIYMKTVLTSAGGNNTVDLYEGQLYAIASSDNEIFLGAITIPDIDASSFTIKIYGYDDDISSDVNFHDLILFPVDEWACRYNTTWYGYAMYAYDYMLVDSISNQKEYHTGKLYDENNYLKSFMTVNGSGQSVLQPNKDQKLWFYLQNMPGQHVSGYHNINSVQLWRMARYLAMRGNR